MKLYLVQHADALSKADNPERPLSEKGVADAVRMAAFLDVAGVRVDEVVHSGKKRAQETANILANAIWPGHSTLEMEGLSPNDSTDHLYHGAQAAGGDICVVGHLPFMERIAARLLTGTEDGLQVGFTPATIVCLQRDDTGTAGPSGWHLVWMQTPDILSSS
ncbi:phosphohistidine phosphatase SixA [Magnetovibrio sp. PR-2]|uniref:phosphohistidine phosphatase SixA n=1 Tax=Magnetovibrio sp. PR-2 TaxID=3120356 RepID=UPI002FCE09C2